MASAPPASLSTSSELTFLPVRSRPTITIGTLILFDVLEQICLLEDPAGDDDHAFGSPLEDHLQIAVEELALRLRVDQQRQVVGRLKPSLNSAHDGNAKRIGEIVGQHGDCLAAAPAQ